MSPRRDLVPFVATLAPAAVFVLAVARWSRPAAQPATQSEPATNPPRSIAVQTPPTRAPASPTDRSSSTVPPPPSPPGRAAGPGMGGAESDAASTEATGVALARERLDAVRARLDEIDVDAGGGDAVLARRMLLSAAAPAIYEALGEGGPDFDERYEAYRVSVADGGAMDSVRAERFRPEELQRAALLDELRALLGPETPRAPLSDAW